jgi:hypothetical protein
MNIDFTLEEKIIAEAIIEARKVQEYIWQETSAFHRPINYTDWGPIFQKRVDKILEINCDNPHYKIELRKRMLQQAALSILALRILDES